MGLDLKPLIVAMALLHPAPSAACDLALALAVDVSGSVDTAEFRLQMDGLSAALNDPIIAEALVQAKARLSLVQWTGSNRQTVSLEWTEISDFDTLNAFAERVASEPRKWRNYSTAIGEALEFTLGIFPETPVCARRLIDVSGDGKSNEGKEPREAHPMLRAAGVTVNALAIEASEPELTAYFFENVLVGEGAFVVTATDFEDYPKQIRKKLLREVTVQTTWHEPASNPAMRFLPLSQK